jgi:hypothetical protein
MKRNPIRSLLAAAGLVACVSSSAAAAPNQLTYTGELMAANGLPYTGEVAVTARIFGAESGGGALFTQDLGELTVMNGTLQAELMGASLASLVSANDNLWLEFEVDGETLAPRQKLSSVPYALTAGNAEMLGGTAASAYLTEAEGVTAAALPTDGINKVSNGALTNKFAAVTVPWSGAQDILDAEPAAPPPPTVRTINTNEGPGSYVTAIEFRTRIGLNFVASLDVILTPPASSGVGPITLESANFVPGTYDKSWTVANTPALTALLGQQLTGVWTLTIVDKDNTAAGSPAIGQLQNFDIKYDVVRANHMVVNGRLDVSGNANVGGTVTAGAFVGDGKGITGIFKFRNITTYENATRVALSQGSDIVLDQFSVDKKSPTSILIVDAHISASGEFSDYMTPIFRLGAGNEINGQQYPSDNGTVLSGKNVTQRVVIAGHAETGPQNLVLRFRAANNQGGNRPFNVYNPNSADDARLAQTRSVYVVWEIEP